MKTHRETGTSRLGRGVSIMCAAAALALAGISPAAAQDSAAGGLAWRSYAEIGLGAGVGGAVLPLASTETGIYIGAFEIGNYYHLVPLEYGAEHLFDAVALCYGGSVGYRFELGAGRPAPFLQLGLGGIARDRTDATGAFDGDEAERAFSANAAVGAEFSLGGRWKARLRAGYRFVPDMTDYQGRNLSSLELSAAIRADWHTVIR